MKAIVYTKYGPFNDVEIRLRWLNEKLNIERAQISKDATSVEDVFSQLEKNSAQQAAELSLPKK